MVRGERQYSEAYRRRIERRLNGLTIEQAHARGLSLAAARGHRRRPGEPAEKAKLDIRRRERGELTERERRFARKQAQRLGDDYKEIAETMLTMLPEDRDLMIEVQARAERGYNRRSSYRWDLDPRQPMPFPGYSPYKRLYYYH